MKAMLFSSLCAVFMGAWLSMVPAMAQPRLAVDSKPATAGEAFLGSTSSGAEPGGRPANASPERSSRPIVGVPINVPVDVMQWGPSEADDTVEVRGKDDPLTANDVARQIRQNMTKENKDEVNQK